MCASCSPLCPSDYRGLRRHESKEGPAPTAIWVPWALSDPVPLHHGFLIYGKPSICGVCVCVLHFKALPGKKY